MNKIVNTTQVYVRKDGMTLLLRRVAKKENDEMEGKFVAVGGRMELGETIEESAAREVKEETGLKINNLKFRGTISYVTRKEDANDSMTCIAYVFESTDFSGDLLIGCNEGELFWVKDGDIFKQNLLENDLVSLKWIYEHKGIFMGAFITDELNVKKYRVEFI